MEVKHYLNLLRAYRNRIDIAHSIESYEEEIGSALFMYEGYRDSAGLKSGDVLWGESLAFELAKLNYWYVSLSNYFTDLGQRIVTNEVRNGFQRKSIELLMKKIETKLASLSLNSKERNRSIFRDTYGSKEFVESTDLDWIESQDCFVLSTLNSQTLPIEKITFSGNGVLVNQSTILVQYEPSVTGMMTLNVDFTLKSKAVFNGLEIEFDENSESDLPEISEVVAYGKQAYGLSVLSPVTEIQETVVTDIRLLPVMTDKVRITFKQPEGDIRIRRIAVKQHQYASAGSLASTSFERVGYVAEGKSIFWPERSGTAVFRSGQNTSEDKFVLDGPINYRVDMKQNEFAIQPQSLTQRIKRAWCLEKGTGYTLDSKPYRNLKYAYRPTGITYGKEYGYRAKVMSAGGAIRLPKSLSHLQNPTIKLNGSPLNFDVLETVASNTFGLSADRKLVSVGASTSGGEVEVLAPGRKLRLDAEMKMDLDSFDPDPNKITVEVLGEEKESSVVLRKFGTSIKLPAERILSAELTARDGTVFTEVFNRTDLYDAVDRDYLLDYEKGVLLLAQPIGSLDVVCRFRWREVIKPQFEVYGEARPEGIRLLNFTGFQRTQTIDDSPVEWSLLTETYQTRHDVYGSLAYGLRNSGVIRGTVAISGYREVAFQDGVSEFLGLANSRKEKTFEILATVNIVEFSLAAGSKWYADFGVRFGDTSVFSDRKTTLGGVVATGDYYVDPETGIVSVWIGTGNTLPGGISIAYSYVSKPKKPGMFSVDYEQGIIYFDTEPGIELEIRYQCVDGIVRYDDVEELLINDTMIYGSDGDAFIRYLEVAEEERNLTYTTPFLVETIVKVY